MILFLCQPYNGWSRGELRRSKNAIQNELIQSEGPDPKEDKDANPTPPARPQARPQARAGTHCLLSRRLHRNDLLAHGFTVGQLDELIRAGFATAQPDRMRAGDRAIEVTRARITEAGREIVEKWR